MKRYFYILAALLASACSEGIVPDIPGAETMLCLSGTLNTSDTLHTLYASYSRRADALAASGARVRCYIDGELQDVGTVGEDGKVALRADICPGDSVRFVAESDAPVATADLNVLPAARFELLSHEIKDGRLLLGCRLWDDPEKDNFYKLDISLERTDTVVLYGGHVVSRTEHADLNTAFSDSPVVNGNSFRIFSDGTFSGASIPLCAKLYDGYLRDRARNSWRSNMVSRMNIVMKIYSLDIQDYWTSVILSGSLWGGALDPSETWGDFGIPDIYPCNVSGGVGLVSVRTVTSIILPYSLMTVDQDDNVAMTYYLD